MKENLNSNVQLVNVLLTLCTYMKQYGDRTEKNDLLSANSFDPMHIYREIERQKRKKRLIGYRFF